MKAFVGVQFEDEDKKLLVKVCRDRRETVTDFVRRSVMAELARLNYLPASEAKALGVLSK